LEFGSVVALADKVLTCFDKKSAPNRVVTYSHANDVFQMSLVLSFVDIRKREIGITINVAIKHDHSAR
jgi:hypothetical protein